MFALIIWGGLCVLTLVLVGCLYNWGTAWGTFAFMAIVGVFILSMIGLGVMTSVDFKDYPITLESKTINFEAPNGKDASQLRVVLDTNGYYTLVKTEAGKVGTVDGGLTSLLFHGKDFYLQVTTKKLPAGMWNWRSITTHYILVMPEKTVIK